MSQIEHQCSVSTDGAAAQPIYSTKPGSACGHGIRICVLSASLEQFALVSHVAVSKGASWANDAPFGFLVAPSESHNSFILLIPA